MVKIPEHWYFSEIGPFYHLVAQGSASSIGETLKANKKLEKFNFTKATENNSDCVYVGGIYVPENSCLIHIIQKQDLFTLMNIKGVKTTLDDMLEFIKMCNFKADNIDFGYIERNPENFKNTVEKITEMYGKNAVVPIITEGNKKMFEMCKALEDRDYTINDQFGFRQGLN